MAAARNQVRDARHNATSDADVAGFRQSNEVLELLTGLVETGLCRGDLRDMECRRFDRRRVAPWKFGLRSLPKMLRVSPP